MGEFENMKGLSVILTFALLVLAQQLAWRLSQAGALPRQQELPRNTRSARLSGSVNHRWLTRAPRHSLARPDLDDSLATPRTPDIQL